MLRLLICLWVLLPSSALAQKQVTLQASDGLTVSADIYTASTAADATWIVLAHQAGASRGEYRTIAPRLNKLGYNAIALDQRSGRAFAGVTNKTAALAKSKKKSRSYLDRLHIAHFCPNAIIISLSYFSVFDSLFGISLNKMTCCQYDAVLKS